LYYERFGGNNNNIRKKSFIEKTYCLTIVNLEACLNAMIIAYRMNDEKRVSE
jgi:hypothetical protein